MLYLGRRLEKTWQSKWRLCSGGGEKMTLSSMSVISQSILDQWSAAVWCFCSASWHQVLWLFESLDLICFIQSATCHPEYVALCSTKFWFVFFFFGFFCMGYISLQKSCADTFSHFSCTFLLLFLLPVSNLVFLNLSDFSFVFIFLCLWSTAEQLGGLMADCMQLFVYLQFKKKKESILHKCALLCFPFPNVKFSLLILPLGDISSYDKTIKIIVNGRGSGTLPWGKCVI